MPNRGCKFWEWADCALHHRSHDEKLSDGTTIDVQARLSRDGHTQMFMGVYGPDGALLAEEYYPCLQNETISRALVRGAERARFLATSGNIVVVATPRKASSRAPRAG